jgi:hypothetical protein
MTTQIVTAAVMVSGELVNLEVTATDGVAINLVTSGTVGAGGGIACNFDRNLCKWKNSNCIYSTCISIRRCRLGIFGA